MLAGHPALDLANTLHWRDGELLDFVTSYHSLVDWAAIAGLLTEPEKTSLQAKALPQANQASTIHTQWQNLRTALKAWLPSVNGKATNQWPASADHAAAQTLLENINAVTEQAPLSALYAVNVSQYNSPTIALPLLRSATTIWTLMTFPPAGLVRQCEADSCGGYFIDQSRAKPRRWCSMDSCGNRAKAMRYRKSISGA